MAKNYFVIEPYFLKGVRVYSDMKPERVLLKVSSIQTKYFRSLQLHRSQKEVEFIDDYGHYPSRGLMICDTFVRFDVPHPSIL